MSLVAMSLQLSGIVTSLSTMRGAHTAHSLDTAHTLLLTLLTRNSSQLRPRPHSSAMARQVPGTCLSHICHVFVTACVCVCWCAWTRVNG